MKILVFHPMSHYERNANFVMLFLVVIIAVSLILMEQGREVPQMESQGYEKVIWTDKERYELGETIEAAIVFINKGDQPVEVYPIYSFTFSGNSVYDPMQITGGVFVEYAEDKIPIPANGNITFTDSSFTPTYPGPFKITGLGLTKIVNVTGYKEATLNSTGISLKIEPSIKEPKDRDYVEFSLFIVNENLYPVKVPSVSKIYIGYSPDDQKPSVFISWLYPYLEIDSNSSRLLYSRGYQLRYPGFGLYMSVEGVMVSIELEVEQ